MCLCWLRPRVGLCKTRGASLVPRAAAVAPAPPAAKEWSSVAHGPTILNGQVLHSISQERLDVVRSLEDGYLQTQVRTDSLARSAGSGLPYAVRSLGCGADRPFAHSEASGRRPAAHQPRSCFRGHSMLDC
jgi:hypothetical protein